MRADGVPYAGGLGRAMAPGSFQCRGIFLILDISRTWAYCACSRCGRGLFGHFSLSYLMITTYNTAVTDAASEILGKGRRRKKPWVTKDVLDLCDERRDLKKKRYEAEGAKEYREANRRVQKAVKKTKEDWIGALCEEIETCLNKNNSKRAYQLVKDLPSEKQGRSSTIQDKSGKCLSEEKEILSRWTECCTELYNYESCGENAVLDCSQPPEEDLPPILREEVEIAVASLKKGKSGEQESGLPHGLSR